MATLAPTIEQTGSGIRRSIALANWNLSRALIVTKREVQDMFRDWRIIAPTLVLTLIFPTIANWGAGRMIGFMSNYGANLIGERLVPFLLMVVGFFPISFSLIIALESFVGEKERHSLEPLLATPLTNTQLYMAKVLSSTLPPIVGSLLGVTVYLVGVKINIHWLPPMSLLIQIILMNLVQAFVMVSAAVVVSSQTTSVRAANLLASFIIIPMSFLIQAEAYIMFWAQYDVLWMIIAALLVVNFLLIRMGVRIFNREEMLGNEIDEFDVIGGVKSWWRQVLARRTDGTRRSAWRWYREEVLTPLVKLWPALIIVAVVMAAGYFTGLRYAKIYRIPSEAFDTHDWLERFQFALNRASFGSIRGVLLVIFQNVRVLAIASVAAVFSFGVLALMVLMLPLGLAGYLSATMVSAGIDPVAAWTAILPHSLIEIPAAIVAGAAALRLGATIIAPPPGKTLGQAWIEALADATRLWLTVILPLLIVAGCIEVFITPYLFGLVAGR